MAKYTGEIGCLVDGHNGIYAAGRVIELAIEYGWPGTDGTYSASQDARWMNDYEAGWSVRLAASERVHETGGWLDEAEEWLNANLAPEGYRFGWENGEFFLSPSCGGEDDCDDDRCMDHEG